MQHKSGRCHCGNIRYTFEFPDIDVLPARACGCTFCVRHGGVYTSNPGAALDVVAASSDDVRRYRFGHETAEFVLCRVCGVLVFAHCEIDGNDYAVLNINTFDDDQGPAFERSATDFESESIEQRLARRRRNWIGTVTFSAPDP